jgi:hypothetical protein
MNNGSSNATLWKLGSSAAFFLYGLFCVVTQTAYCPGTSHDDYLYTRMEGRYAIAFGASLVLLSGSFVVASKIRRTGGKDHIAWMIRGIGIAIVAALGWYALSGGANVG